MSDEELKKLIASNAKAIEALTTEISEFRVGIDELKQEWQKDRRGIYDLLSRLARAQADFYETQSDFYRRFDEIDEHQTRASLGQHSLAQNTKLGKRLAATRGLTASQRSETSVGSLVRRECSKF